MIVGTEVGLADMRVSIAPQLHRERSSVDRVALALFGIGSQGR